VVAKHRVRFVALQVVRSQFTHTRARARARTHTLTQHAFIYLSNHWILTQIQYTTDSTFRIALVVYSSLDHAFEDHTTSMCMIVNELKALIGARTAQLTEWQLLVIVDKLNPTLNDNMQVI